jgi:hypothetical protein
MCLFYCLSATTVRLLSIMTASSSDDTGTGCLVLLIILGGLGYAAYTGLDNAGWIQHTHEVNMYMQSDWLEGENRKCSGLQTLGTTRTAPEISSLFCPEDYTGSSSHNLTVKFWGKVSRRNVSSAAQVWGTRYSWRCSRNSDGFVCRALD